jgi:hypothetical protein
VILGDSVAVREVFDGSPEEVVLLTADPAAKTITDELKRKSV